MWVFKHLYKNELLVYITTNKQKFFQTISLHAFNIITFFKFHAKKKNFKKKN